MRPRLMRKREHGLRINVPCWQARASPLTAKHSVALMMPVSAHRTCLAPSCMRKPSSSPNSRLRKNQRDSQTSGTTGPSAAGRCTHYGGCVAYSDRVGQLHCRAEEGGLLVHRQRESAHPASRYLRFEIGVFSPLSTRQSMKPAPASAAAPEPRSWLLYAISPYPFSALLGLATYPQHFAAVPVRVIPLFFA